MRRFGCAFCLFMMLGVQAADVPPEAAAQIAKFKDPSPMVRQQAVTALGKLGEKAKPALPQVVEMLADKNTWVMTRSLMVIAQIGPDETVIKPVAPYLAREHDISTLASDIFVKLGEKGIPALLQALKDDKSAEAACEALSQMGPAAKAAIPALTDVSQSSKSKPVRDTALKTLKAIK